MLKTLEIMNRFISIILWLIVVACGIASVSSFEMDDHNNGVFWTVVMLVFLGIVVIRKFYLMSIEDGNI